jgi:hypothetical protein
MGKNSKQQQKPIKELLEKLNLNEKTADIIIAVLLSISTVAAAWSGYQASRWGGVQSTKYSEAGALRVESTRASNQAGQITQVDIGLFTNWVNAFAAEDQKLAAFYEDRFRNDFKISFNDWLATNPVKNENAPKSPFDMPSYVVPQTIEANELEIKAEQTFNEGKDANQQGDDYVLNTVFLASVLFLSGIAAKVAWQPARLSLVLLGIIMLLVGLLNLIRYPVT